MTRHIAAALALTVFLGSTAAAQDVRTTLENKARKGDRLTVEMYDRGTIQGRLVSAGEDILTLDTVAGPASIPYSSIDRVKRRKNGVLLGTLIGLGTGIALGIPAKMLADNETGDGTQALLTIAAIGAGAGMAVDAALSVNRTIYRRSTSIIRVELTPSPRGVAAGVRATW
jgi:hypothetical protein